MAEDVNGRDSSENLADRSPFTVTGRSRLDTGTDEGREAKHCYGFFHILVLDSL